MIDKLKEREGLGRWALLLATLLALVALFTRDPSLFTHAQFWAEDGKVFYAQAWNLGWARSLLIPNAGYLNTVQRIGAGLALLVPLRHAPLAMMCWGLFLQILPVPILLSSRCRNFASLPLRIAFAAAYIAYPNSYEIHVVCTNSQWHLIVSEMLLAFAAPPSTPTGKWFDIAVFSLGSVSGPFGLVLLLPLSIYWFIRRHSWSLIQLAILVAGAVVQLVVLHMHPQPRLNAVLHPSRGLFVRLLGGNAFIGSLFGPHAYGYTLPIAFSMAALLLGAAICLNCVFSTSWEMKLFMLCCFLLLTASLLKPAVDPPTPAWQVLLRQASSRYWFLPGLALLFSILRGAIEARARAIRVACIVLTAVLIVGIVKSWELPPLANYHFDQYVEEYNAAPPGAVVGIPINPPPDWQMNLVKR